MKSQEEKRTWPQAVVHVEPELQASPCPETPEPEPELDVKPPGHDDGHVPYLRKGVNITTIWILWFYICLPLLASATNVRGVWVGLGGTPRLSDGRHRWSTLAVGRSWSR